jgi:hypothetical protein
MRPHKNGSHAFVDSVGEEEGRVMIGVTRFIGMKKNESEAQLGRGLSFGFFEESGRA